MPNYTGGGYPLPRPDAGADDNTALRHHNRDVALRLGQAMQGKINAVGAFTCTSGTTTTVLTDTRLTPFSFVSWDPLTANAATELGNGTIYCLSANRNAGSWSITHASAATGDRTFNVLIIG